MSFDDVITATVLIIILLAGLGGVIGDLFLLVFSLVAILILTVHGAIMAQVERWRRKKRD
jgi:hypothetical protein